MRYRIHKAISITLETTAQRSFKQTHDRHIITLPCEKQAWNVCHFTQKLCRLLFAFRGQYDDN